MDCSIFHMLRCFRFALHQKDISGGSRSPEVRPRCIGRWHESGQVEVVNLLLEAKASVTVKDDKGRGPRLGDVMGF